jgi:HSP20 family protein
MFDLIKKNDIFDVFRKDDLALKSLFDNLTSDFDSFFGRSFNVDIVEEEENLIFKAELPGMEKNDLTVDLNNNVLSIKADKKRDSKSYLRAETYYGSMSRSFTIPYSVDENVDASYKDGILTLVLKKKVDYKQLKKIEIK